MTKEKTDIYNRQFVEFEPCFCLLIDRILDNIQFLRNTYFIKRYEGKETDLITELKRVCEDSKLKMTDHYEIMDGLLNDSIAIHNDLFERFMGDGISILGESIRILDLLLEKDKEHVKNLLKEIDASGIVTPIFFL